MAIGAKKLKNAGRLEFEGVSNLGLRAWTEPEFMQLVLASTDDGRFNLFLLAYNFVMQEMGE